MLKFISNLILGVLLLSASLQAKNDENAYVILRSRPGAGMFSVFDDVGALLKKYDKGLYAGVEIDFADTGEYYDADHGPNWWQYYCQPIVLGSPAGSNIKDCELHPSYVDSSEIEYRTSRHEAYDLIQKYIHLHSHITQRIDTFVAENFSDAFVFGVHYRGTDKIIEAPRVRYQKVPKAIESEAKKWGIRDYKIFIATDEQAFIEFMLDKYGDRVIYLQDVARTSNGEPIHLNRLQGQYQVGEDALCDCCLLSRTDVLIRTSSNLSRWSTYFNPDMPVVELSKRHQVLNRF